MGIDNIDRRTFLRGAAGAGAAAAGLEVTGAAAADKRMESLDIDAQLQTLKQKAQDLIATIERVQEERKKPRDLGHFGDELKSLSEVGHSAEELEKLIRPFKGK